MKCAAIDGAKFRALLAERGIRQRALSEEIGVTHYNVSRWCQLGVRQVKIENMEKAAKVLGMTTDALLRACSSRPDNAGLILPPAEAELLNVYRELPPLYQAKARLAIEEVRQSARPSPHGA